MAERMASAEEWMRGHEDRCEDRQLSMGREIRDLKDNAKQQRNAAWTLVVAILGFLAVQAYNDLKPAPAQPGAIAAATSR